MTDHTPTPEDDAHVCKPDASVYYCPTAGETESDCHGGFDVCCDRPDLHQPIPTCGRCGHPADEHSAYGRLGYCSCPERPDLDTPSGRSGTAPTTGQACGIEADVTLADPHDGGDANGCPEDCPVHNWRSPDIRPGAGYPAWARDAQSGIHTPGCDCGHDDMGPGWHANDCAWKADWTWYMAETAEPAKRMMVSPHPLPSGGATVAADMCPRCKAENTEAWTLCAACEAADRAAAPSTAPAPAGLRERIEAAVREWHGDWSKATFLEAADAVLAVVQPLLDELVELRTEHERVRLMLHASRDLRTQAEATIARVRELAEPALLYDDVPQDRLARQVLAALIPPAGQPDH